MYKLNAFKQEKRCPIVEVFSVAKDMKWYINCAISLCIMIFFRFIPAPEPMTELGITVVGLFLGCIYGWCTTNMIWPSLFALVLFAFTGYATTSEVWTNLIGNASVGIIFWLMLCVGLLKNTNLIEYIATWSITRKFTEGKPWLLIVCVYLCLIVCGLALDAIAVILVFWAIMQSLFTKVGYKKGDREVAWAMFSVVCFTQFGGFIFPFKPAVITCFGFLAIGSNGAFDGSFNYGSWIIWTSIICAVIFVVYLLISKLFFRIDLSKFKEYKVSEAKLPPLDKRQKISLIIFLCLLIVLLAPSFLPKTLFITQLCNTLGTTGAAMLAIGLVSLLKIDGKPLLSFDDLQKNNVVWSVIMMFGTALVLCACINSKDAGVSAWLQSMLLPVFGGMSPFVFVATYLILCIIITNFINNAVVGAIMIPVSYSIAVALGINPVALCACIIVFVDYGLLLPSASPSGSMLYSNGNWIPRNLLWKYCIISIVLYVAVSLFIGWPLAQYFFPWTF